MYNPIPVILCGRTEQIGATVVEAVKPELEGHFYGIFLLTTRSLNCTLVIHFIMTSEAGVAQILALLRGEKHVPSDSVLGSKNYNRDAEVIIFGTGYDNQAIQLLRDASKGLKPDPWLRPDTSKPTPPLGP